MVVTIAIAVLSLQSSLSPEKGQVCPDGDLLLITADYMHRMPKLKIVHGRYIWSVSKYR